MSQPDWTLKLIARIIAAGVLIAAITFGATRLVFGLESRALFGRDVDVELQLALLGLVNKIMDLLVTISLEDLAAVTLTVAIAGRASLLTAKNRRGVHLSDFELAQELTKPWQSIAAFYGRCKIFGWSLSSFARFVVTLIVSVCVLLQGLSLNTIGMPKERWYEQKLQRYPAHQLHDINLSFWDAGFSIVGGGDKSWDAAMIYSAAIAYSKLQNLAATFGYNEHGWQLVGTEDNEAILVAVDTVVRANGPIRGVAIKTALGQQIFDWLHANGSTPASDAIGWNAGLQLLTPMVSARCVPNASANLPADCTFLTAGGAVESNNFTIDISSSNLDVLEDISDFTCTLVVSQVIFPVSTWITHGAGTSISPNSYGNNFNATPTPLPTNPVDSTIANRLRIQMGLILEMYETARPNLNFSSIIHGNARRIQEARASIENHEDAIAAGLTMIASTLIGYGLWNVTMADGIDEDALLATDIAWQVYGSGPRLAWQWITVVVLSVLIASLFLGIIQAFVHRVSPAAMLKPQGMLVAANSTPMLESLKVSSVDSGEAKKAIISIKTMSVQKDRVALSDSQILATEIPVKRKKYIWSST